MNKQELKCLLENIYSALTEEAPPPRLLLPDGPTGPPPTPPDVYRNDPARNPNWTPPDVGGGWTWRYVKGYWRLYPPPVVTPLPPKPKPTPTPDPELRSPRPTFDPRNPFGLPPYPPKPIRPNDEQRFRDILRGYGLEDVIYPSLFN